MTPLVKFYRGEGRDSEGRLLSEIWAWGNQELEDVHDFIQWLFPLPEPSRFNADAPLMVLGEGTNEIQKNVIARQLIARARPAGASR